VPDFQPDHILRVLANRDVDFVLIGGLAATAHGSPHLTYDVDITPDTHLANLTRLSAALSELGARIRAPGVEGGLPFDHESRVTRRQRRVEPDH
jgi:hypothetical protein